MTLHRYVPPFSLPPHGDALAADGWHVIAGRGAATLQLPAHWPSLWMPMRGRLSMQAPDANWTLIGGEAQLWRGGTLNVHASHESRWLALVAAPAMWARAFGDVVTEHEPLPWRGDPGEGVHDAMERLAHDDEALALLFPALIERQRDVAACLPRCRGRTLAHRRQALLRLLNLRHLMLCHVDTDDDAGIDVPWLAERAHYSAGHLIRLHRAVFGETPSDYFTRLRQARAWELVRETDMPVATITHRLGFESQSAFCRAFKHAFGMTATQARREADACAA
ncbi:helix-turn-helix transcriptional regulator [Lysobacter auxotrophicus]|uniref:Helix-turn-helix transcriptional regulator n=1 Tax=Lysobacter auxotrophicus TaxID=2992573 RepID=A0ABM8DAU7_9GAMM|nr:helix-turn-helix transcriptional regulator [Lysobacter auxotrophicus]BDU15705.1 helix-turn-helix transcriptional regulator [Lysobacter auxotrophicus]